MDYLNADAGDAGFAWVINRGMDGKNAHHYLMHARYLLPRIPDLDYAIYYAGLNDVGQWLYRESFDPDYLDDPENWERRVSESFRISDYTLGVMANPFYIDLGFTKTEIASVIKVYGLGMTILGVMAGGPLIARYGTMRPLLASAVLIAASNLLFALMAVTGRDLVMLTVVISVDNIATGLSGTVFLAYLASLTNAAYTATQYALFSSIMSLPGKVLGGFSGVIVDAAGYASFFIYTAAVGIPSVALVLYLMKRQLTNNEPQAQPG